MLAIQGKVGSETSKAVTELSFDYVDMVNVGDFQYGINEEGIYLLNQSGHDFESSFELATSDFNIRNIKKCRFAYISINTDNPFTLSVKVDNGSYHDIPVDNIKSGLQLIRVNIPNEIQGFYWTFKVSSDYYFRVDNINTIIIIRPQSVKGY